MLEYLADRIQWTFLAIALMFFPQATRDRYSEKFMAEAKEAPWHRHE